MPPEPPSSPTRADASPAAAAGDLARAQERAQALEAIIDIVLAAGTDLDLDRVLALVATHARALTSARAVAVELLVDGDLVVAATDGEDGPLRVHERIALPGTLAERALRDGVTVHASGRTAELCDCWRLVAPDAARAVSIVPLAHRGRPLGAIAVVDPADGGFTAGRDRVAESFAAAAAMAIAAARDVADHRVRSTLHAQERERARWARELHDETLQGLAGLQLLLAGAHRASTEPDARRIIGEAIDAAARQVDALRALITEMRPLGLDELGLQTAIDELVTRFRRRTGVTTTVTVSLAYERGDAPDRLDADIETAAYRIVQEALTNVDRHAAATTVDVSVVERGELSIRVRDDGIGFGPRPGPGGFGLTGMRERADLVGGRLHVTSDDEHTTVEAQLPAVHGDGALSLLGQTDA